MSEKIKSNFSFLGWWMYKIYIKKIKLKKKIRNKNREKNSSFSIDFDYD